MISKVENASWIWSFHFIYSLYISETLEQADRQFVYNFEATGTNFSAVRSVDLVAKPQTSHILFLHVLNTEDAACVCV